MDRSSSDRCWLGLEDSQRVLPMNKRQTEKDESVNIKSGDLSFFSLKKKLLNIFKRKMKNFTDHDIHF
jgi:hypothetical protein